MITSTHEHLDRIKAALERTPVCGEVLRALESLTALREQIAEMERTICMKEEGWRASVMVNERWLARYEQMYYDSERRHRELVRAVCDGSEPPDSEIPGRIQTQRVEECECCGRPATQRDVDGVPLCDGCYEDLKRETNALASPSEEPQR